MIMVLIDMVNIKDLIKIVLDGYDIYEFDKGFDSTRFNKDGFRWL